MNDHAKANKEPIEKISFSNQRIKKMKHPKLDRKKAEEALRKGGERLRSKLSKVLLPVEKVEGEELRYIIDSGAIQSIMDDFYSLTQTGVAGILDLKGNILAASGWQDICTRFHRVHPMTSAKCRESDLALSQGVPHGEIRGYKCKNNLWDFITPIYVGDKHIGNLYLGQFFFEDEVPDYDLFDQQADQYGFDKAEYRAALDRVPRLSRERFNTVVRLYRQFADMISGLSFSNLKLASELTERKQIEDALNEETVLHRILVEQSRDGIVILDENGRVYEANQQYADLLGYTMEELRQLHIWDWDTQWTREQLMKMLRTVDETGDHFETRHCRKDGTFCDVEISTNGAICGGRKLVFCVCRDITDRKLAERALRESEIFFRDIFEQAAVGMSILSPSGDWLLINQRLCDILGYSRNELMKMSFRDITHPEHIDKDVERVRQMADGDKNADSWEKRYIRSDGRVIWVRITTALSRDEKGRPKYFISVTEDITAGKQAKEELQNTLGSLREAVDATIQVMVSAVETRDPYTAGHQLRATNLACAIATEMGLPQEKIEGIRMAGSIHDIGKLSVPAELLSKPTQLNNIEFSLIKEHAQKGYDILKNVESSWPLAEIVYQHHERMNGSGYPRNLKGDDILMEARILAVSDVVESMASHRPYRPALGLNAALGEIERNRGALYDADVVDACVRLFRGKAYEL